MEIHFAIPEWLAGALGLLAVELVLLIMLAVRHSRAKKSGDTEGQKKAT